MATTVSNSLSFSAPVEAKAATRHPASSSHQQCVSLPTLPPPPPVQSQNRIARTYAYCRKAARNVKAMATGDVTAAVSTPAQDSETPEFLKIVQDAWEKVEDKYAVSSLAVAGTIGLVATSGMISAIDRLPLVPGVLELVGIGYTGWFAYKNLIYTPDREALIKKVKDTYKDIIGSS